MIERELLERVKAYIGNAEVSIGGEWGVCRDLAQLIDQGAMPKLYHDVIDALKKADGGLEEKILKLRNEVNCRVEHGAESGGHLEFVEAKLNEILKQ